MNTSKIEELRKLKKFTQDKLALDVGISKQTFLNLMKSGDFRISHLERIAELFKVDICIFFKNESDNVLNAFYSPELEALKKENKLLRGVVADKEKIIKLLEK